MRAGRCCLIGRQGLGCSVVGDGFTKPVETLNRPIEIHAFRRFDFFEVVHGNMDVETLAPAVRLDAHGTIVPR